MRYEPHLYQKYCQERIISDSALALFLDMGLGKTAITLTAVNALKYHRFEIARVLVIAPKKVAESTWAKEAQKWDHLRHLRIIRVLGTQSQRIRALNTPGDVWIINRENTEWITEYYRNAWPFDMVVVDEFSSFKNASAKRTKALNRVRPHIKRIVGLTGTPAPNGLMDLWSQIFILDRGERLGKTLYSYQNAYFLPDKRGADRVFSYKPGEMAEQTIWQKIGDICVCMKAEDYLELPDFTTHLIPVELDVKARAQYDKLEREAVLAVAEQEEITAGTAAALTNKLLQLCNGAVYDENRNAHVIHRCKIEAFTELIESLHGKPVLVFYAYKHDLAQIHNALEGKGLRVREMRSVEDEDAWNRREVDVLLAHPASAGHGLNLQQGGNHVIWFGLTWNLEQYQQANARLYRQGQTQKVIAHHLIVSGGMDEDVMAALEGKGDMQERLKNALRVKIDKIRKGVA